MVKKEELKKNKLNFSLFNIAKYQTRGVPREAIKKCLSLYGTVVDVPEQFTSKRCYFCKKVRNNIIHKAIKRRKLKF